MKNHSWHLDVAQASLANARLQARLDLALPAEGLGQVRVDGIDWPLAGVLGFEWGPGRPIAPQSLLECVVRGDDLIASYGETPERPVRVDASWRLGPSRPDSEPLGLVELVLSVRTSLLDSRPALFARSRVPAAEVLQLSDASSGEFAPVESVSVQSGPGAPPAALAGGEPSCLVFRHPGEPISYVEMVHPADFPRDEVLRPAGADDTAEVRHQLFTRPLEKGVVLRSRVCAAWVRGSGDLRVAAECYRSFADSEPPLGS